jgi:hypothetical protein
MAPVKGEPLDPGTAKALIRRLLELGAVRWSSHALDELKEDELTTVDAVNVLRGGQVIRPAELKNGTWRYRVMTNRICVVVAFDSMEQVAVVTAWRISIP